MFHGFRQKIRNQNPLETRTSLLIWHTTQVELYVPVSPHCPQVPWGPCGEIQVDDAVSILDLCYC